MKRAARTRVSRAIAAGLVASIALPLPAAAGDHGHRSVPMLPAYAEECGSCHVPFPSRMLPGSSWQRIIANLGRHFGTDASLDPAMRDAIAAWLDANSGKGKYAEANPPEDRITRSSAFIRKHREVAPATWARASIGRPSNCGACHPRAIDGAFDEHDVRIPR